MNKLVLFVAFALGFAWLSPWKPWASIPEGMVIVDDENFQTAITKETRPVLGYFWSPT